MQTTISKQMFDKEHQNHIKEWIEASSSVSLHIIRNLSVQCKELRMRERICIQNLANKLRKAKKIAASSGYFKNYAKKFQVS
jgi:hypothetical protein